MIRLEGAGGRLASGAPSGYSHVKASILAVDDQPANLMLLEQILREQGYSVRSFPRCHFALEAAARNPPDLILLDINMPEMSGLEMCRLLKADAQFAAIPVIFLSAVSDAGAKVQAFACGGADYVTKPFQVEEVRARVETHLNLHRLQKELQLHANHLEELVQIRTRELVEAQERLKALDQAKSDFLRLISHEFRSPLNGILGVGELLLDEVGSSECAIELGEMFHESRRRILTTLEDALLLTEIEVASEQFSLDAIDLSGVLEFAIDGVTAFARSRQVRIQYRAAEPVCVLGERELLSKAFQALLETAVKFSQSGEAVRVDCEATSNSVQVLIQGGGEIPTEALPKFFDVFAIGEAITPGGDLGLRLNVSRRVLSLLGGSIAATNLAPSGIQLTVFLKTPTKPLTTNH